MFGGIKRFVEWNRLGMKLGRAQDAVEQFEKENKVDGKEKLLNAAKHLLLSVGAIALAEVGKYLAGPDVAGLLSKDVSPLVVLAVVPLLHAAGAWIVKHVTTPAS